MPRYLVERTFCDCTSVSTADQTADRRRSFCIVDSPSPEAIRVAAQATSLPVERITEVGVFAPYFLLIGSHPSPESS